MTPGACGREERLLETAGGAKSYCGPWGRWTNCREAGRCLFDEAGEGQTTIFDFREEEDEADGER